MDRKLRNAWSRTSFTGFAWLLGVTLLLAESGCASRNGVADSPVYAGKVSAPESQAAGNDAVNANFGSDTSAPSTQSQSSSGLVYDRPYIWTQAEDPDNDSGGDASNDQKFFKYVFHRNGTCESYCRTRKSWLGPSDDSDGSAWTLQISGAPFQIKSAASGSSIRVDWSKCQPDTPCAETGANSDDAFLDIQSAGFRLVEPSDQSVFLLQRS